MSDLTQDQKLNKLAEVAIQVGLGLAPGQELVMTAPLDALPLVRRVTEQAYRAGASLVTTLFTDEESTLLRFRYGRDEGFDRAADWLQEGVAAAYRSGAARLAITGTNPALLAKEDPGKVSRANLALSKASRPALDLITRHEINWTIIPCATPAWAAAVFPEETAEAALAHLWAAIFAATRIDTPDPVAAWRAHDNHLQERARRLNEKRFAALQYRGPGTVTFGDGTRTQETAPGPTGREVPLGTFRLVCQNPPAADCGSTTARFREPGTYWLRVVAAERSAANAIMKVVVTK